MFQEFNNYEKFKNNKYKKLYCNIIEKSINENQNYDSNTYEKHHILPKSLGGTIMVNLTFREHYICHLLLTKFTAGSDKMKMCFALHTFFHFDHHRKLNLSQTSKLYESHKKLFNEMKNLQYQNKDQHNLNKDIFIFKHRKTNETFTGNRKQFKLYSGLTDQEIYNLITSKNKIRYCKDWGVYMQSLQMFSFELPFNKFTGKIALKTCEHCGKSVDARNFMRWHGNNCKFFISLI